MPVTSNVKELHALRALLKAPEQLHQAMLVSAAGEAKKLVQMGFRNETDPDNLPWAPLKHRPSGMILRQTARMANSFTSVPTGTGFRVGSNVTYVTFHQGGTKGLSKDYSRTQAFSADKKFVRGASKFNKGTAGKARVRVGPNRFIIRNGKVKKILGRKKLTYKGIAGQYNLQFKAGSGAIPVRRMVPANGTLTTYWKDNIDRVTNVTMWRAIAETGGHK